MVIRDDEKDSSHSGTSPESRCLLCTAIEMQEGQFFWETKSVQLDFITKNYKGREEMHKNYTTFKIPKAFYDL